jgi:hypothetical protein
LQLGAVFAHELGAASRSMRALAGRRTQNK